jgi:hypothetical protein
VRKEVQRQEHRLGGEVEPAPVDEKIEMIEVKFFIIAPQPRARKVDPDDAGFLRAGLKKKLSDFSEL